MSKYLIVHFKENNTRWGIPVEFVAADRAKYYAQIDANAGEVTFEELYPKEYEYSLRDTDELFDWINNNMDWEDVIEVAFRLLDSDSAPDYSKWFTNAPKYIGNMDGSAVDE